MSVLFDNNSRDCQKAFENGQEMALKILKKRFKQDKDQMRD